jgi:hypothetical protein
MKGSDNATRQTTLAWRHAGPGLSQRFQCAKCRGAKLLLGRKRIKVRGMPDWVCAECAKGVAA